MSTYIFCFIAIESVYGDVCCQCRRGGVGVRVEMLRQLEVYEPTAVPQKGGLVRTAGAPYWIGAEGAGVEAIYRHFPLVMDPDGSLWRDAGRYLLGRLDGVAPVSHRTLESIAGDLAHFRRWLLEEEVDYLSAHRRPRLRPTYRYCAYLHDQIRESHIQPGTAKRRMSSVQGFYRWLERDGRKFEFPLWIENDASLRYSDSRGFLRSKAVKSTDLTRSFRSIKGSAEYGEYIQDGGKLRPLPKDEQVAVVEALQKIGNTEMLLSFLLALTTGARLQTVFTLRRSNFADEPRQNAVACRIKVGRGTLVDTKYGKQMVILVPVWLYRKVQVYMRSPRCLSRVRDAFNNCEPANNQYLFLTRTGRPYYLAQCDALASEYRSPPRGNSVTQFIRQQLTPWLRKEGFGTDVRFHDLRATYGMNLLEASLNERGSDLTNPAGDPEIFEILMRIRERMGHSSLATTERYLKYSRRGEYEQGVQVDYEGFLREIAGMEVL